MSQDPLGTAECRLGQVDHHHEHDHDHHYDHQHLRAETPLALQNANHFSPLVGIVGKKWEPRNPVPGPFSAKIRKVNQNSESRREFGN